MKRAKRWSWLLFPKSRRDRRRRPLENDFFRPIGPEPLESRRVLSTVTLSDSSGGAFAENGGTDIVTATLDSPAASPVTVGLDFGGTAVAGTNYSTTGTTITIGTGQSSGTITLTGIDTDTTTNQDVAVSIDAGTTTGATIGSPSSIDPTLTGDPSANLSIASSTFVENAGTDVVTATLTSPATGNVTIDLGFTGTAVEGTNYSASLSTISIASGQTAGSTTLTGIDTDTTTGQDLTVSIGSGSGAGIGDTPSVSATLIGDPSANLSIASSTFVENAGTDVVTATLTSPATGNVTIDLAFTGTAGEGTNYSASLSTITIASGQTTGSTTLTGIDTDTTTGQDLTVSINSGSGAGIGDTPSVSATLIGDPTVTLSDSSGGAFAENGGTDVVTATLSAPATGPVTIDLGFTGTAQQTTNFSASSQMITIAQGATTGSITLTGIDTDTTSNQDLTVSISSGSGAATGSPSLVSTSLTGDPTVTLSDSSGGAFAENGGTDVVTATLSAPATGPVTIDLGFSGTAQQTTNFSASSQMITIAQGATTGSITLTGVDTDTTSDQDLTVSMSSGSGAAISSPSLVSTSLTGDPTVTLSDSSGGAFAENGGTDVLTATLSAPATGPVTIDLGFSGTAQQTTNFSASSQMITIAKGATTGSITLTGVDTDTTSDQDLTVSMSSGSGAAISSPSLVSTSLTGDPTVTLSDSSGGAFAENGGTDVVTATLSAPATGPVTIDLGFSGTAQQTTNFSASSQVITIAKGATTGSITLTGVDTDTTSDQDLTVSMSSGSGAAISSPSSVSTSLTGDPTVSLSQASSSFAENGGTDVVTATLSAPATGPVTIDLGFSGMAQRTTNFSASSEVITIAKGATIGSITLTGIDTDTTSDQDLTVSMSSGSGAAISSPSSVSTSLTGDPTVSLSQASSSFAENGGTDVVTATLSAPATGPVTIDLGFSGMAQRTTNFSASSEVITIAKGATIGSITLTGIDTDTTSNQDLTVSISSGSGAATGSPALVSTSLIGDPTVNLSLASGALNEDGGTDTVTATLSAAATTAVTIQLNFSGSATQNKNYSASGSSITIAAGSTTGTITLTGIDTASANSQNITVGISSVSTGAVVGSTSSVTATLTGDPTVNLSLSSSTLSENAGTDTVTATLSAAATSAVTVNLAFAGTATSGTGYSTSASSITIAAGSTTGTITLTAIDQSLMTGNQTIIVSISSVSTGAVVGSTSSVTATIEDNDAPAAPTSVAVATSSDVTGLTNYVTTDTPSITITAATGSTVEVLVNGTQVATATESSTAGQFTATIPAGDLQVGNNSITTTAADSNATSSPSTAMTMIYAPAFADVYTVPGSIGSSVSMTFNYTSRNAAYNDEVGYYVVSDSTGTVNSIAPGSSGYAQAALSSATVLFSGATNSPGATKTETLTGGELIAFYLVQNNSTANFLANNPSDTIGGTLAFFSIDMANPDPVRHVLTTGNPTTGNVQYSWEDETDGGDRDYNDMVISVVPPANSGQTAAALDVPGSSTDSPSLTFTLENLSGALPGDVGIYTVTDASGAVSGVDPGGSGYAADALTSSNSQVLFAAGSVAGATQTITLAGGTQFGFYTINSGTTSTFLSANSGNSASGSPVALFSFDSSNPDNENHFRWFDPEGVSDVTPTLNSLSDPQLLHVMDQVFGSDSDFDSFDIGVQL